MRVLVEQQELADAWQLDSALPGYTVGALTGHVLSTAAAVERYLDVPPPAEDPIPRGAYYGAVPESASAPELHAGIRQRGAELARAGHAAVAVNFGSLHKRLTDRLANEHDARIVSVMGGLPMRLADYLETRIVELAVHHDDLAISVHLEPEMDPAATKIAIDHLVQVARYRHGDREVLRALTRRERTRPELLCVF